MSSMNSACSTARRLDRQLEGALEAKRPSSIDPPDRFARAGADRFTCGLWRERVHGRKPMASLTATPTAQGIARVASSTIVRSPVIKTTGTP